MRPTPRTGKEDEFYAEDELCTEEDLPRFQPPPHLRGSYRTDVDFHDPAFHASEDKTYSAVSFFSLDGLCFNDESYADEEPTAAGRGRYVVMKTNSASRRCGC